MQHLRTFAFHISYTAVTFFSFFLKSLWYASDLFKRGVCVNIVWCCALRFTHAFIILFNNCVIWIKNSQKLSTDRHQRERDRKRMYRNRRENEEESWKSLSAENVSKCNSIRKITIVNGKMTRYKDRVLNSIRRQVFKIEFSWQNWNIYRVSHNSPLLQRINNIFYSDNSFSDVKKVVGNTNSLDMFEFEPNKPSKFWTEASGKVILLLPHPEIGL